MLLTIPVLLMPSTVPKLIILSIVSDMCSEDALRLTLLSCSGFFGEYLHSATRDTPHSVLESSCEDNHSYVLDWIFDLSGFILFAAVISYDFLEGCWYYVGADDYFYSFW
jgi:hypothetical protein